MLMQLVLWLEIVQPPVFRPADLTQQFESQARERSMVRRQIEQLEARPK